MLIHCANRAFGNGNRLRRKALVPFFSISTFSTYSPWDMGRFFARQCSLSSITIPKFARKWINLRKMYRNFYKVGKGSLEDMVNNLGMTFEGRPHSGMDDARNIARILQQMVKDGCELKFNEYLCNTTKVASIE